MTNLEHSLERTILIRATRETVFRYFQDPRRFADWWGAGSSIEGRPGGAVRIVYPGGETASGTVLEVEEGRRIVFSYGYDRPGKVLPPGGSRVTIRLEDDPRGTRLTLRHDLPDAAARDAHLGGWRYQLALFANVAAREQHAGTASAVDRYFAAWAETDAATRREALAAVADEDVAFRDAFGCTSGVADLDAHIAAAQLHMPGVRLRREGDVRQCQGTALVDWVAIGPDGSPRGKGTSVFDLGADGRISGIAGFWS
jgi:uncharacterized protein YndB with AHSA1/START domain